MPPPAEERLRVAALLSIAGGFLDAFTWVGHGGVFANAQTGNVVLLGVFAATAQWHQAVRHVPPIIAFLLGVFTAQRLRLALSKRSALFSLGCEVALLVLVAATPAWVPDLPIVLGVAFVAAMQSSSFTRVEGSAYSSVMTTGNLRRMTELLVTGTTGPRDRHALRQGTAFAVICGMFALGAGLGAWATVRFGNPCVLAPVAALMAAFLLCL
jgi:uncharacterized membrane protein YoaK (UPF0700 family)